MRKNIYIQYLYYGSSTIIAIISIVMIVSSFSIIPSVKETPTLVTTKYAQELFSSMLPSEICGNGSDDDGDGFIDELCGNCSDCSSIGIYNGSFEIQTGSGIFRPTVPGWLKSPNDNFEVWESGENYWGMSNTFYAYDGHYAIELNANVISTSYQIVNACPGAGYSVVFAHMGRASLSENIRFVVYDHDSNPTPGSGTIVFSGTSQALNSLETWQLNRFDFVLPSSFSGNSLRLELQSHGTGYTQSLGNILDAVDLTLTCSLIEICNDGIDNDFDGNIDNNDCDCGPGQCEAHVNGSWTFLDDCQVEVCEGDPLILSIYPNGVLANWSGPNGYITNNYDLNLGTVQAHEVGDYTATFNYNGCTITETIEVAMNSGRCEAHVNGSWTFLDDCQVEVCEGDPLILSIYPNGVLADWSGPNGYITNNYDLNLGTVQAHEVGDYTATFNYNGCTITETIEVAMNSGRCEAHVNGSWTFLDDCQVEVCEGDPLILSIYPNGVLADWSGPNGYITNNYDLNLGTVQAHEVGDYTATFNYNGCTITETIEVAMNSGRCEAHVNGSWTFLDDCRVEVCEGDPLILSIYPNGVLADWSGPNGYITNNYDLNLGTVQAHEVGDYTATFNYNGCTITETIEVAMNSGRCEAHVNGSWTFLDDCRVEVCEGDPLILSIYPNGVLADWSGPNGYITNNYDLNLGTVQAHEVGNYTATFNYNGCAITETIEVVASNTNITPRVSVNGGVWTNSSTVSVTEGGDFSLGTQNGLQSGIVLTLPGGGTDNTPSGNSYFSFTNASSANAGTYTITYTDANGCTDTQNYFVQVNPNTEICDNEIDDDGDGFYDELCGDCSDCSSIGLYNGGFELGVTSDTIYFTTIPGWQKTPRDCVEIWSTGFVPYGWNGVTSSSFQAYEGNHALELNANTPSTSYQIVNACPGASYSVVFAHMGRSSLSETVTFAVYDHSSNSTPGAGTLIFSGTSLPLTSLETWQLNRFDFYLPAGYAGGPLRLELQSSNSGSETLGNLLDAVNLTLTCSLVEICNDGMDNDFDGDTDCDDDDCDLLAQINPPVAACANELVYFTAADAGAGASYIWSFGTDATPATATGRIPPGVSYSSCGNKTVNLEVVAPGLCTGYDSAIFLVEDTIPPSVLVNALITVVECNNIPAPVVPTITDACDSDIAIEFQDVAVYHTSKSWKSIATCDILYTVSDVHHDDNGTSGDTSDDLVSFTLTVIGQNVGSRWTTIIGASSINGSYYSSLSIGPFATLGVDLSFSITDNSNSSCSNTVTIKSNSI